MPGQGDAHKQMTQGVRDLGKQIDALEDQIADATAAGQDTTALEQQLDQLEAQMKTAQANKKKAFQDYKAEQKAGRQKR